MENRYGYFRQGSGVWRSLTDGDFEEEDVWAVLKERRDSSSKVGQSINEFEPSFSVQRRLPSAARMIPTTASNNGNISSSSSISPSQYEPKKGAKLQSAPVKIPVWSKLNAKKSKKTSKHVEANSDDDDNDNDYRYVNHASDGDDDDDDDDGDDQDVYNYQVPPHEFIATRLARSQISSFSVFEGVGRTLKGRDLSKVRNAILTKTGFLEQ